ncbi:hypothetical protein [Cesiribacter andamanensis]|nr:hypothetical protein [Cesiribacter andamanensis]
MKAPSLLRQFWAACFVCGILMAATGISYASGCTNGTNGKAEAVQQKEIQLQQEDSAPKKKTEATAVPLPAPQRENPAQKVDTKTPEVKKEGGSTTSFSFLFYLFYKGNFAETTNNAIRSSLSTFIQRILE